MRNLPDNWSWSAFNSHFGDDIRPEREDFEDDPTPDDYPEAA